MNPQATIVYVGRSGSVMKEWRVQETADTILFDEAASTIGDALMNNKSLRELELQPSLYITYTFHCIHNLDWEGIKRRERKKETSSQSVVWE